MTFIFYSAVIGCDEVAHCKFNDPGICVFVFALILTMVQDQALVASKHFLIETENKNVADNAEVGRVVCFYLGLRFALLYS